MKKKDITYQLHLEGPGLTNRVVRFKALSVSQVRQIDTEAMRAMEEEAKVTEFRGLVLDLSLKQMLRAVSKKPVFVDVQAQTSDQAKKLDAARAQAEKAGCHVVGALSELKDENFIQLNVQELSDPTRDLFWDNVFDAKETALLEQVYRNLHEMPAQQVNMLAGKASPVGSED